MFTGFVVFKDIMNTYIVKNSKTIGLMVASNTHELFVMLDVFDSPYNYQYTLYNDSAFVSLDYVVNEDEDLTTKFTYDNDFECCSLKNFINNDRDYRWCTFTRDDLFNN